MVNKAVNSINNNNQHMKNEAADLRPCEGTEHPKFGKKFLKLYNAIIQFKEYDQFIINNYYMNTCKDKIGLANKVNISNNSDPNEDNTLYIIARFITYLTKRDHSKWFLSLYLTKVRLKTITILNSMKFLQNSSNMNLKTTNRKYIKDVFTQIEMKVFHHTNGDKLIPKSYIIRDGLDTSNINGVIILNI
ncbi:hypothetical protein H8356DRAFT_1330908 [Neocallimastix lanati (nom. inval.)]|nr:hypothetical protein H8356DRAFT_1330908 [Neocallimastix sp. JGI-2020a]